MTVFLFVIMALFTGFLIELDSIFSWISWIQWISAIRYASNILAINEFKGTTFCLKNATDICPLTGTEILNTNKIDHMNAWDLGKNFLALILITFGIVLIAYIQLLRIKKLKWSTLKVNILFTWRNMWKRITIAGLPMGIIFCQQVGHNKLDHMSIHIFSLSIRLKISFINQKIEVLSFVKLYLYFKRPYSPSLCDILWTLLV